MQRTDFPDTPAEFRVLWQDCQKQLPGVFLKILHYPLETSVSEPLL